MFLELNDIQSFYGKSQILHGVSLGLEKGEMVALLGRNGVGKSTTLKSIIGLVVPKYGSIRFKNEELVGLKPHRICHRGVGYVPEDRRIFPHLTVHQNLLIGMKPKPPGQGWSIEKILDTFPQLGKLRNHKGRNLSGGEQQMLTIARTLMGNPDVLLVDEPSEGLAPLIVELLIEILVKINRGGASILLVEHAIDVALDLAQRAYVMSKGEIVFAGSSQELRDNREVWKLYLEV